MRVMSIEEFRDRDAEYLGWVAAHPDGYVINIGRSQRGYVRLLCAACGTITSRLWVPKTSSTSREQAIFVDHATSTSMPSGDAARRCGISVPGRQVSIP
jgi:hypothetical protein